MRTGWDEAREAVRDGLALAPLAARRAWLPLAISSLGWAALFVAGRADLPPAAASPLGWTGVALVVLMTAPKLGALHRLAAGAPATDGMGHGGLQWGRTEARLAADSVALATFTVVLLALVTLAAAAVLTALRPLGQVQAGPLGPLGVGFLLVSPALLLALAVTADAVGRLMATLSADAVEQNARFARGWLLTRRAGAAPALVLLLTVLLPWAALLLLQGGLDGLDGPIGAAAGGASRWSWPEAALAGGALAALSQFAFAPLNAGALRRLYVDGLAAEGEPEIRADETPVDTSRALGDKAHPARIAPALTAVP